MCRWLAYSGSPVLIEQLLYKPKHSLIDQSLHSTMGAETTNGDGFGVGWYDETRTPGVFHSIEPAWNDRNLQELARHVRSHIIFAHIRASSGSPVQQTNCHPFRHGRWLWMHNGVIHDFQKIKRDLVLAIDPELYPFIEGSTDSETLFYLAKTFGLEDDPPQAVARAIGLVEAVGARTRRRESDAGDDRDLGRRQALGLPLLERARLAHALLQHRDRHAARALPGQHDLPGAGRGHEAGRLRAARRPARRVERGARVELRRRAVRAAASCTTSRRYRRTRSRTSSYVRVARRS